MTWHLSNVSESEKRYWVYLILSRSCPNLAEYTLVFIDIFLVTRSADRSKERLRIQFRNELWIMTRLWLGLMASERFSTLVTVA